MNITIIFENTFKKPKHMNNTFGSPKLFRLSRYTHTKPLEAFDNGRLLPSLYMYSTDKKQLDVYLIGYHGKHMSNMMDIVHFDTRIKISNFSNLEI